MKKKYKIIILLFGIWLVFITTDSMLSKWNQRPIFSLPIVHYKDGGTIEYYGLGYKIIQYRSINNKMTGEKGRKDTVFGLWNLKYDEKKD